MLYVQLPTPSGGVDRFPVPPDVVAKGDRAVQAFIDNQAARIAAETPPSRKRSREQEE